MPPSVIFPAVWFRREDDQRIRRMMRDRDHLPETFEQWLQLAEQQLAQFAAQGMAVEKVIVDPEGLAAFCAHAGIEPDQQARVQYAIALHHRNRPGHG